VRSSVNMRLYALRLYGLRARARACSYGVLRCLARLLRAHAVVCVSLCVRVFVDVCMVSSVWMGRLYVSLSDFGFPVGERC